jgi:hypothetical protein
VVGQLKSPLAKTQVWGMKGCCGLGQHTEPLGQPRPPLALAAQRWPVFEVIGERLAVPPLAAHEPPLAVPADAPNAVTRLASTALHPVSLGTKDAAHLVLRVPVNKTGGVQVTPVGSPHVQSLHETLHCGVAYPTRKSFG